MPGFGNSKRTINSSPEEGRTALWKAFRPLPQGGADGLRREERAAVQGSKRDILVGGSSFHW